MATFRPAACESSTPLMRGGALLAKRETPPFQPTAALRSRAGYTMGVRMFKPWKLPQVKKPVHTIATTKPALPKGSIGSARMEVADINA